MVGMEDIEHLYRQPLIGKLHSQKSFYLCFQNHELWYLFSLCFRPWVFNLAIKGHGSRVSTFFFKAPAIESIIVILSVMCIVPKYDIVFCMIVILLILKYLFLVSFKTPKELLHLCFASLMEASEIPLYYVQVMCIVILLRFSVAYYSILALCDLFM